MEDIDVIPFFKPALLRGSYPEPLVCVLDLLFAFYGATKSKLFCASVSKLGSGVMVRCFANGKQESRFK